MSENPFGPAAWLAHPLVGGTHVTVPAPYFRKAFRLPSPARSASLTITALGLYECEINGKIVGEQVFAPGWTDYNKRVPYQVHDVTLLVQEGDNAMGMVLGDGWYCGHVAWMPRQNYGDRPKLLARLLVVCADGSHLEIVTDGSWKTSTGPVLANDMLAGETYDARLEAQGWSAAGFDDSGWGDACRVAPYPGEFIRSPGPPVRRIEELPARELRPDIPSFRKSRRLFDFEQNFSGRVRLKVVAPRGTTLSIRHAEILNPDQTPYYDNLRGVRATDYYTCRGNGEEVWEPRFVFHGFRYAEVDGLKENDTLGLTGIVLHSDMEPTGSFSCSHPLLNQLYKNIVWGQKSNFLEVPTDCPQRNERLGWTGDAQVFIRTACFNMDVRGFFHKWMQDLRDAQSARGGVPAVAPNLALDFEDGGPAWSDATVICPWVIYLCYNDRKILEDHYESIRLYLDFQAKHRCLGHIRVHPDLQVWSGFGDWLALDGSGRREGGTPPDLIGTAFYAHDLDLASRIAEIVGRHADAEEYRRLHGKVKTAFQNRFLTPDGLLTGCTQTSHVLALHFDLVPENCRTVTFGQLVRDIEKRNFHLSTGFVGTPYLLEVLEDHGRLDLAYKLLEQETFPSWLFPVKNGATTIWERWDGWTSETGFHRSTGMNSFNHYAYGAVGAWMVRSLAGLDLDPEEPGYRHIIFRPRPGGSVRWARAELKTSLGRVCIRWELKVAELHLELEIPNGARGTIHVPAGFRAERQDYGPGCHRAVLSKEAEVL